MLAVIYRCHIKENHIDSYKQDWEKVARYFIAEKGAIGSVLHRAQDGSWVAYSRWPNPELRDAAWPKDENVSLDMPEEVRTAILGIKNAIDPSYEFTETIMEVVEDLLI